MIPLFNIILGLKGLFGDKIEKANILPYFPYFSSTDYKRLYIIDEFLGLIYFGTTKFETDANRPFCYFFH